MLLKESYGYVLSYRESCLLHREIYCRGIFSTNLLRGAHRRKPTCKSDCYEVCCTFALF